MSLISRAQCIGIGAALLLACSADDSASGNRQRGSDTNVAGSSGSAAVGGLAGQSGSTSGTGAVAGSVPFEPTDACAIAANTTNEFGVCELEAPPDSFDPIVKWTWEGGDSALTPLVANLTDDNGDGKIDLCDTPDVVVVTGVLSPGSGVLAVLDGATGKEHFRLTNMVDGTITPALGDIDGDGVVEIVAAANDLLDKRVVVFEHDGTLKWTSSGPTALAFGHSIALADIDADGDVEIIASTSVVDHTGNVLWKHPTGMIAAVAVVDLDGDMRMEIIDGPAAYRVDGSIYYQSTEVQSGALGTFPQVANFDDDPQPEVLVTAANGIFILAHDGTTQRSIPAPAGAGSAGGMFPATVHDFDGDGQAELAASSGTQYTVYERDLTVRWSAPVVDSSGVAGGTAFDFLGDGVPEAMYADEHTMWVFDGRDGAVKMQAPRSSGTLVEYPTVADIDNDGHAEVLLVTNNGPEATVQAIEDREDRWIPTRRIWNQDSYHVTNVNEDGSIPQHEAPHWLGLNSWRTNAQFEAKSGGVCIPIRPD